MKRLFLLVVMTAQFLFAQSADMIFRHGKVWTVDEKMPQAEAIAVIGDRILAVGSDQEIAKYIGAHTQVLDLKGKLLLPGFIDNHVHFVSGGFQLLGIDLRPAKNPEELIRLLGDYASRHPKKWITGGDWDHESWPGTPLPRKEWIDSVSVETPIFVSRLDGHMGLANSLALKLAGIDRNTPDPPGGEIVRDSKTGEPTGILKDEAMTAVYNLVPAASEEENIEAARAALKHARQYGITSLQDITPADDFKIYQILLDRGELTARMDCRLPMALYEDLQMAGVRRHFGSDMLRIGSLKAFADGSLGSSTALFFQPYEQDPNTYGLAMDVLLDGRLESWCKAADKAMLQLSVHAIGDSANSRMLDIYAACVKENPMWDRRFRIEHAQHIDDKDFSRFAELGVIASVQPYHLIDDGRWAAKRIGEKRCRSAYPLRTFLDQGVHVCFGTDWTVAPINPLWGIYAAVTRRTLDGKHSGGWIPEQKISVEEAIACYTIHSAYATFDEDIKGSLTKGKLADLVVLSDDILTIPPEKIWDVEVEMTVLGGKVIYCK
ncbi:amidohydrolase [candidate division KSB1 bacterium]|nr:amidohydrolase [candidate division KSB1 bacterium]